MNISILGTSADCLRLLAAFALAWSLAACGGGSGSVQPAGTAYQVAVNFSPYEGDQDPNTGAIVDETQIARRLDPLIGYVKAIRTFGATHGLERIPALAQARGLQVWAGAWISRDRAANEREITALIEIGRARQAAVLIVGSEVLLRGDLPESDLLAHMARVRAAVPADIPVTTADTYGVLLSRPAVMSASDIVFANFHPYWEGLSVEQAMSVIHLRWSQLKAAAAGKRAVISEIGWPSGGAAFGAAVPAPANAARFFLEFTTWARANGVEFFYFAAADEAWKAKTAEGEVGRHWGLWFADSTTLKPGMQAVFDGARSADTWTVPDVPGGPGTPSIAFTFVPALGGMQDLSGRVLHVHPANHVVAVYIRVNGAWWMKPTLAQPKTPILPDRNWVCDITTGGIDEQADTIAAFVIPAVSELPVALGARALPPALSGIAVANLQFTRR
jgi:exo-beta-1,3-glucanase (GH17 family)